MGNKEDIE